MFERLILVLIFYFPLFALACVAAVLARFRPALARTLYRVALISSVLPYLLHVWYVWGWITESGDPHPKIGVYPGLISYGVSALAAVCILLAAALLLVRRAPAATALLPPALWLVYWYVCLPRVYRNGAPEFAPLDSIPLVWLFAFSAFATVLLIASVWFTFGRRAQRHLGTEPRMAAVR